MQIPERLTPLVNKDKFSDLDHQTLEDIDRDLTEILVKADKQCSKFKRTPWSPKLHNAYIEHRYWALQASSLKTRRNYDHLLDQLRVKLGITNNDKNHRQTIRSNLRRIQQTFRDIRKEAAEQRTKFLNELLTAARTTKNKTDKNSSDISKPQKQTVAALLSLKQSSNRTQQEASLMY